MSVNHESTRNPDRIEFARDQRQRNNEFAAILWHMVRGRRLLGQKFRREHPLGPYTLDFVCLSLKLNVEVDGSNHLTSEGRAHDERRDAFVRAQGFEVLRIPGFRLTQDPHAVRLELEAVIKRLRAAETVERGVDAGNESVE